MTIELKCGKLNTRKEGDVEMYVVKLEGKESRVFENRDEALALAFELKRVFNDLKVEVIKIKEIENE